MSVALDILRTYRAPRRTLRSRVGDGEREDRALAILMAACVLIFVSKWPGAARQAYFEAETELNLLLASHLFTWVLVAPLFFYAFAWLVFLALRAAGAQVTSYRVRIATFWALLAATPLFLLTGLTNGFVGPSFTTDLVGAIALAVLAVFWLSGLAEIARPRPESTT